MVDFMPDAVTEHQLCRDLVTRAGSTAQLAQKYGMSSAALKDYVRTNRYTLQRLRTMAQTPGWVWPDDSAEPSPQQLADLWISNKLQRLRRLQQVADRLFDEAMVTSDSTVLREFRSYLIAAANELGQLLHRGAGDSSADGEILSVDIAGIDMDALR